MIYTFFKDHFFSGPESLFSAGGDERWKTEPLSVERRSKVEWRGGQSQPPWYIFELRIELKKFSSPVPACHRSPERQLRHAQVKVEKRCESDPPAESHSSIPRIPHAPSTAFPPSTPTFPHHIPQVATLLRRRRDTSSFDEACESYGPPARAIFRGASDSSRDHRPAFITLLGVCCEP